MNSAASEERLLQASLLLVDDDVSMIRVLRQMLGSYSDIRFATNGQEAIRLALERPPDLLLLDAEMPDMRGMEVFRRFKADPLLAPVAIIFLTGHASSELEASTLDQGAADFLSKPASAVQVNARVRAQLRLRALSTAQRELNERLELALDAGHLGAWEWTLETDRMTWHRSMQALRGETAPRVTRFMDHVAGLDADDQRQLREAFEQALSTQRPQSLEYSVLMGGDRRRMRSSLSPVRDASGQLSRLVGVDQDITEAYRASALLKGANRQLEQFVYFASHDLQAPARQSASFAELAAQRLAKSDAEGAARMLQKVIESGERQQDQIRSFLDLARHRLTEPGEWQHIDMGVVVRRVVDDLAQVIESRGTLITIGPMDTHYLPVNLVAHVWRNLIGNAIRHQSSTQPQVWIGQIQAAGVTNYFVEDSGNDSEQLIARMASGMADAPSAQSTGLGLEICRRVLRVLGGSLWAEQSKSGGARVLFSLGNTEKQMLQ